MFIGDLMAVAEDAGGGRKKKRGKRAAGKKKKQAREVDGRSGRLRWRGDGESRFHKGACGPVRNAKWTGGVAGRGRAAARILATGVFEEGEGVASEADGGAFGAGFFAEDHGDGDDCFEALGRQLPV